MENSERLSRYLSHSLWPDPLDEDLEDIQDCEWCQNYDAVGLFNLNDVETGLCAECAEDNNAERCE